MTSKKQTAVSLCALSLFALSCGSDDKTTPDFGDGGAGGYTAGGGTAGGSPGGTAGGSPGGNPGGGGICMATTVGTGRGSPDMLIVLDRSGSMDMGTDRWSPSVSGIKRITASLQDKVSFGLMAFPGTGSATGAADCMAITDWIQRLACFAAQAGGGGGQLDRCQAGTVNVPIGPQNATIIATALDAMRPNGATPTAPTLEAAHAELGRLGGGGPDDPPRSRYVLLVTDGAPNCTPGSSNNGGQDPVAVEATVAAIQAMAADGIKTYVLGYDTQTDPELRTALDRMAVAGATGDTAHRPVENEQSLVETFEQISGSVLSCDFRLDNPVNDKRFVRVTLDQQTLNVDSPNGWVLGADRQTVTLQGSSCQAIKQEGHLVTVTVECDPVPLVI